MTSYTSRVTFVLLPTHLKLADPTQTALLFTQVESCLTFGSSRRRENPSVIIVGRALDAREASSTISSASFRSIHLSTEGRKPPSDPRWTAQQTSTLANVMLRIICCSRLQQRLQIEVCFAAPASKLYRRLISSPVGGIYSVLKSKAPVTTAEYGDRYTLIGPLNRNSV